MKAILSLVFCAGLALSTTGFSKSLEWQKIELEDMINRKYSSALASGLSAAEFLVKSEVRYNDPGMPNFSDLNKSDFKVSDLSFDESKGDYIAFSKVGLEVPVVGKLHQDHQRQLKELYRYNESMDLFKNIESVSVQVSLSDTLSPQRVQSAKNIINAIKFDVAGFIPQVKVNTAPIQVKIDESSVRAPAAKPMGIMEFVGKFGNAIGLILAVCLFGFLANKLLKMYMEFMERIKGMESSAGPERKDQDKEDSPASALAPNGESHPETSNSNGFERFEKLFALNPKQAAALVRKWIKDGGESAKDALTALVQQMDPSSLRDIFSMLSMEERESWNSSLGKSMNAASMETANRTISDGVMKEMVGGNVLEDGEVLDLILGMGKGSVKQFVLNEGKYAKVLLNLLNPEVISFLLNDLSIEEMEPLITQSMSFTYDDLEKDLEGFKETLRSHSEGKKASPFNQKLLAALSGVEPAKEQFIYRHLANSSTLEELTEIACKQIPSELVVKLPKAFLKFVMVNYPMDKKIDLLGTVDSSTQEILMDSFLQEGTNAKEMVLMELETLEGNELRLKRAMRDKNKLWGEFLDFIRAAALSNKKYEEDIRAAAFQWAGETKAVKLAA